MIDYDDLPDTPCGDDEALGFWQQVTPPILYSWFTRLAYRVRTWWARRQDRKRQPSVAGPLPPYHPNCRCAIPRDAWSNLAGSHALNELELRACALRLARYMDDKPDDLADQVYREEPS